MSTLEQLTQLSIEERLLLIEALWDSLDEKEISEQFEFDNELKKELDERLDRLEKGLSKTYSWQEVKESILNRK